MNEKGGSLTRRRRNTPLVAGPKQPSAASDGGQPWSFIGLAMAQVVLIAVAVGALVAGVGDTDDCPVADTNPGADILACLRDATAFLSTPAGTGTGLVLDDGHVVTNAHVVNPFSRATVVVAGSTVEDVPVVGVDLAADIAVLGPLEDHATTIRFGVSDDVVDGGTLFLVGYPGEVDEEPDPTIAQGILSRRRNAAEFGLSYLQTDASIGRGQSGGALVNGRGEVVGISSLRFADSFALALTAEDAMIAIERILDGDGDQIRTWPVEADRRITASVDSYGSVSLLVPAQIERTRLRITVPPDAAVVALDMMTGPIGASANLVEAMNSVFDLMDFDGIVSEIPEMAEFGEMLSLSGLSTLKEVEPNRYEVPVEEGQLIILDVTPADESEELDLRVNLGAEVYDPDPDDPEQVEVGESVRAVIDGLTGAHDYEVRLERGQEVEIRAASPAGDMIVSIVGPDDPPWAREFSDDGGGGLYDLDARLIYEAESTGTHTISVASFDIGGTAYLLEVNEL